MRINNNLMAMNTHRQLGVANAAGAKSMEKLSSGFRINRAGDDAAGLAISEKMRGQIRGLNMASRNAQDGISLIQTAEGALQETHAILQRMRELAVQASNDTNIDVDRSEIQKEVDQLAQEITRIANNTEFNQQALLNGGVKDTTGLGKLKFHIGANEGQNISLEINAMDAATLGVARDVKTGTLDSTNAAGIDSVGADVTQVSKDLAAGTYQVTVATKTAGANADFTGSGLSDNGALIGAGTPTADFSSTITYNHSVTGSASSATLSGTGDDLTVTASENNDAYDGFTITITNNTTEEINVDYDAKTIEIVLDLTNGASSDISTLTVNYTGTNPGTGSFSFAGNASGWAASDEGAAGSTSGGADDIAANFTVTGDGAGVYATNGTFTVNGITIDLSEVAGTGASTDGDSFTITGYAEDSTTVQLFQSDGITAIGNAVTIDVASGGTYTIGDTTTGQLDVTFAAGDAAVGSTTVTVATQASTAASLQADNTMSDAVSYGGINVSSQASASGAISKIQKAIETVSAERSKLGAYQNRLEHTIKNLDTSSENLQASESRIRDVDMAKEMMEQTRQNILQQASTAMLAQANMAPQTVLQLLR